MIEIKTENPFPTIEQAIAGAELALAKSYERSLRPYREVAKKAAKDLMKPPSFIQTLRLAFPRPFWSNLILAAGIFTVGMGIENMGVEVKNDMVKYSGTGMTIAGLGFLIRAWTKMGW